MIASAAILAGCAQDAEKRGKEATKVSDTTATATATDTGAAATATDTAVSNPPTTSSSGTDTGPIAANQGVTSGPPAGLGADKSKVNINLNDLPNDVPICSVAGSSITVGDYKRMMRIQQSQANQAIVGNPATKAKLLEEATKRGISLSNEEKQKLVEAAHHQKGADAKQFQEFLKQSKTTEQQFDNEIMLTGLAFKTSNALIEATLLPDLVNRELLGQAAKEFGGDKTALNKYVNFKKTKNYELLLAQTGLPDDALKDEIIKAETAKVQLAKLESQVKITDADVKKLYDLNKAKFKHGDRIKLSTILIMCPEKDIGPIASVKSQLTKANPKASEKEIDAATANFIDQAKQKALILLGRAKEGGDFAKLANENSNDPVTKLNKNGGDMGFIEKKDIIPALGDLVWKLKPGQLLDQVVKSDLGYNIYKVTAKEPAGALKFEEVKDQLKALAKQAKFQQTMAQWLDQRKKIVRIEFTPKFMALTNSSTRTTK